MKDDVATFSEHCFRMADLGDQKVSKVSVAELSFDFDLTHRATNRERYPLSHIVHSQKSSVQQM